jgi:CHAT domain-containing protein
MPERGVPREERRRDGQGEEEERAVVASVWDADDASAAGTMEASYRGALLRGLTPSTALREGKAKVRGAREMRAIGRGIKGVVREGGSSGRLESGHPFFWAPFIYIGLPR